MYAHQTPDLTTTAFVSLLQIFLIHVTFNLSSFLSSQPTHRSSVTSTPSLHTDVVVLQKDLPQALDQALLGWAVSSGSGVTLHCS